MQVHSIKTTLAHYNVVSDGSKTFEVRNDDRAYQKGDIIALRVPSEMITMPGNAPPSPYPVIYYKIGFVLRGGQHGLNLGFVAFSIMPLEPAERAEIERLTTLPAGLVSAPYSGPPISQPMPPWAPSQPAKSESDADFAKQLQSDLDASAAIQPRMKR